MNGDMFPEARVDPTVDLDKRYTTRDTMDLCMRLAGVDGWDLDVAADAESHWAPKWFDVESDGLKQRWHGRVWCNPPFSNIEPWVRKANFEVLSGNAEVAALLLPCNRTEQPWWQDLVEGERDRPRIIIEPGWPVGQWARAGYRELRSHFLPGRVKFGHPGNREAVGVGSPPFGCVLLVWKRS